MKALLWAGWFGHVDAIRVLTNCGANVHAANKVTFISVFYVVECLIDRHFQLLISYDLSTKILASFGHFSKEK